METIASESNKMGTQLDDSELEDLFMWIDEIKLSRPKRNVNRDFSDGVLAAEIIKHYFPRIVEIHNYTPANAVKQKMDNWYLLNRKVFSQLNFELTDEVIRSITRCESNTIERVLLMLRVKVDRALWEKQKNKSRTSHIPVKPNANNDKPEADQNIPQHAQQGKPGHKSYVKGQETTVSIVTFEEKEQECLAKEETIQILQAKIRRLEHLLHLKDIRIDDLQGRLDDIRPTGKNKR